MKVNFDDIIDRVTNLGPRLDLILDIVGHRFGVPRASKTACGSASCRASASERRCGPALCATGQADDIKADWKRVFSFDGQ